MIFAIEVRNSYTIFTCNSPNTTGDTRSPGVSPLLGLPATVDAMSFSRTGRPNLLQVFCFEKAGLPVGHPHSYLILRYSHQRYRESYTIPYNKYIFGHFCAMPGAVCQPHRIQSYPVDAVC